MISKLICLHCCRCDWGEKNYTYCLDCEKLLSTNYFLLAVNRNEAVFLQAWLTTRQEARLPDLFLCSCVCVFGWGVGQQKPNKHTPALVQQPSLQFFFHLLEVFFTFQQKKVHSLITYFLT